MQQEKGLCLNKLVDHLPLEKQNPYKTNMCVWAYQESYQLRQSMQIEKTKEKKEYSFLNM